ncbi:MAG: NAD-dependent DNA ligase LigA [Opitutaceae bacterium]
MRLHRLLLPLVVSAGSALAADSPVPEPRAEIRQLRLEIARHDDLYHRDGKTEISDTDYDALRARLADLEKDNPADAVAAGAELPPVPDDRAGNLPEHVHLAPMLSLTKVRTPAELRAFHARLARRFGREDLPYVVEPKYDGIAVSLTYERGRLSRALTRGNGRTGEDITARVRTVAGLPARLRGGDVPDRIEIRGELHVPFAEFGRVNAARAEAGLETYTNPRALAAGLARRAEALPAEEAAALRLVCFGVGRCEPETALPGHQHELASLLRAWGLPVITHASMATGGEELLAAVGRVGAIRSELGFPTDGAVVKLDSRALQAAAGERVDAPRWAVAYKFAPEGAETRLLAITVQVGRTGALTPVAELAPVEVGGVTVSRATLHSAAVLARLDVRVGDTVRVERAGDVVPAITGVNLDRRPADARPFVFPSKCPECDAPVVSEGGAGVVRCPSDSCPERLRRRLAHFVSKSGVGIDGFGPVLIDGLVTRGLVREPADLYVLRREDLIAAGVGSGAASDRILEAIARSRSAEAWRFVAGLGLPGIGPAAARELVRRHGTLEAIAEAEPLLRNPLLALLRAGVRPPGVASQGGALRGKTFVLTGALAGFTRTEATTRIEAEGGRVAGAVGRGTDYLVAGENPGTKFAEARKRGVPVLREEEFIRLLGGN